MMTSGRVHITTIFGAELLPLRSPEVVRLLRTVAFDRQKRGIVFVGSPARLRHTCGKPATSVKFPKSVNLPGCSCSLSLLRTGYRDKVFAIIGVKVYAAGLYVNPSLLNELSPWKGKSKLEVEQDLALFQTIYQSTLEKSLQIVLVRDVDGKTFWDALDEAVSPRIKAPTAIDQSTLSTFQSIFQGLSLKKGSLILLTWLEPSKMSIVLVFMDYRCVYHLMGYLQKWMLQLSQ